VARKKRSGDIPSRRRDPKARVGFVNFPTEKFPSTGEGGVFVRLVVLDTKGDEEYMNRYVPCCGGYVSFFIDETFLGDDLRDGLVRKLGPEPKTPKTETDRRGWKARHTFWEKVSKISRETELRYFPGLEDSPSEEASKDRDRYLSRSFVATVLLGATGWSNSWRCRVRDLTPEGKALYKNFQKLYPGCEIRLLTFLDT